MPKLKKKHVHLRHAFHPYLYKLTIKPDLTKFSFEGSEVIFFKLRKPTSEITLHSADLDIRSVTYRRKDFTVKGKIKYDKENETVAFIFPSQIQKGEGELYIEYKGIISETLKGFYRSRYYVNGQERWMGATQFESTDARAAFPCIDEPAAKAVFDVTLIIPKHTTAISNTIEISTFEHGPGHKIVKFAPSPKMSTYLVAFLVGEFESVEGRTKEGVTVRVWTAPGKKHQADFALDVGIRVLSFYNKYFGIKYPLPILDMIAVPDFASAAMENWGAVTYRETALLVDPVHSAAEARQRVALVVAHELAHQWFGNLVTMEWWTDLWLNEGFATYIEYLAVDYLFPEWKIWDQFMIGEVNRALELDALKTTHPIEVEVGHPHEIREIFDSVSYAKGASVIRMLAEYLGERDFRAGLRFYLKKFAYRNAKTADLWAALEKVSRKPVRKMMQGWTKQPGYPVVTVAKTAQGLSVNQSRFYSSPLSRPKKADRTSWLIPTKIISDKPRKPVSTQISKLHENISVRAGEWVKVNAGEGSFFRTKYASEFHEHFKKLIRTKKLSEIDRLGIIRDAFALSESGDNSSANALELVESYKNENSFVVWLNIAAGIGKIASLIDGEKYFSEFKEYGRDIFAPLAKKMGWTKKKGQGHNEALLRSSALSLAGYFGDKDTVAKARELFNGIFKHNKEVHPDIRAAVYRIVAYHGGEREFNLLLRRYKKEHLNEEKNRIARALCSFPNPKLVRRALDFSLTKDVRSQDVMLFIAYSMANRYGRDLAWKFIQKNWKRLVELFGGDFILSHIIETLSIFRTRAMAREVRRFFAQRPTPAANRALEQSLEEILSNAEWIERDRAAIKNFLHKYRSR